MTSNAREDAHPPENSRELYQIVGRTAGVAYVNSLSKAGRFAHTAPLSKAKGNAAVEVSAIGGVNAIAADA